MNILIFDKDRVSGRAAVAKLIFEGHDVHGPVAEASEAGIQEESSRRVDGDSLNATAGVGLCEST